MIKLVDNFRKKEISIIKSDCWFEYPQNLINLAQKAWKKRNLESKTPLWNGAIYRLLEIPKKNGRILLRLGKVRYKYHLTSAELKNKISKLPFDKRPNGMFVSSYLQTKDKKLVFAIKKSGSVSKSYFNLIGGNLSPDEIEITKVEDIYNSFLIEFKEETSLSTDKIVEQLGLGIYLTNNFRIGVFLMAKINYTANEFLAKAKPNFEHKKFVVLNNDKMIEMIKAKDKKLNPYIKDTFQDYLALSLARDN